MVEEEVQQRVRQVLAQEAEVARLIDEVVWVQKR